MAVKKTRSGLSGTGLVLAAAVLWGTVGPAQVLAASRIEPAALGGWRLLVGGLALGAVALRRPSALHALRGVAVRPVLRPLLVCAFSTGLYQAAFLSSVSRTGAALATVVALGTAPAATGACARLITGERVGARWLASTAAAMAGCALLLAPSGGRVDPLGLLLGVAAGTCYGLYTVSAKQLSAACPASGLPAVSALSLLLGSLAFVPWMIADGAALRGGSALLLIAWLGLAATAVAYWLFFTGLSTVTAASAGTLSLAEPLAAGLLGVFLLHERLSPAALAGCALIFAGMLAACLPRSAHPRRSPKLSPVAAELRTEYSEVGGT